MRGAILTGITGVERKTIIRFLLAVVSALPALAAVAQPPAAWVPFGAAPTLDDLRIEPPSRWFSSIVEVVPPSAAALMDHWPGAEGKSSAQSSQGIAPLLYPSQPELAPAPPAGVQPEELPPHGIVARGWWDEPVTRPLRLQDRPWPMDLDTLLLIALQNSEHILAISMEPEIRATEIDRQVGQFYSVTFLDSQWNDLNDPVGNTLTTGGPSRYLD